MKKSWIVARHEFLVTIKRVWFVVSTFIFPLFFLGVGAAVLLLTKETVEQAQERVVQRPLGIVDHWGDTDGYGGWDRGVYGPRAGPWESRRQAC